MQLLSLSSRPLNRPPKSGTISSVNNSTMMEIPLVDFSPWNEADDTSGRKKVAQEIVDACKKVGFVYIINHSVSESILAEAFDWSRRFFELPMEEKSKAPHPEGWAVHRGYSCPGLEKVSQAVSGGDDKNVVEQLRQVPDFKVDDTSPSSQS